ncbi:3-oxoadipate enol-lactonase [Pseudochelatococcus contaminans]|uniref:3-oxoadipate enol-lactonase n=1 Tax=Pseudochelatococcus contaminans TaxID=1538103 RepID=A0A7W5Z136_9HYPH|nr:3-oxoadipate enol-lactonase [Pseudochelatococcus contaminans]MBB3808077.1 3-oxoadipate enol-lactonase [Pseudochelatococcus contaminans]
MASSSTFLRANDIVQHYVLHPSSNSSANTPTVVFINALGSDLRIWNGVVANLTDHAQVLLYDKRGHGLSDAPHGVFSIDDYVDDLIGLLDALAIDDVTVVGLSMGGLIAQRFTARVPQRIKALVLSGTAARIGTDAGWATRMAAVEGGGIEAIVDDILKRWFTQPYRSAHDADVGGWRNMILRTPANGYLAACGAIRQADYREQAGSITTPTLCIVGDGDGSTPADVVRETAVLIPGARFAVIEGAGHIPSIKQPAIFADLIIRHFRHAGVF